uniref:MADS-box protein SVP n=1 Tax=Anthurium amnicola TaxID=1678845 RepID=A0A1D1Z2W4_9ARAE
MAREKIKIRKIDNITARQVTFSKRRRGLFKKAQELAILCDADVGLMVFSSTGKLFDYSSTSMKDIIEKHNIQTNNIRTPDQPSPELQLENCNHASLNKEITETRHQLRQLRGEDIQGLTLEELQQLEKTLETGLCRVLERKSQQIVDEINGLQKKGSKLKEDNAQLKQKVMEITKGRKQLVAADFGNIVHEDKQSSDTHTSAANSGGPQECNDSSDTSLRLGLPFK